MNSSQINTENLSIRLITLANATFLRELVNTESWLQYIGERHLHDDEKAKEYIQSKLDDNSCQYWVVYLKDTPTAIGMITLIQRDYLQDPDLGFAFLPQYAGKNYAYESTEAILKTLLAQEEHQQLLAITNPDNSRSIKLLTRLGFDFTHRISHEEESLNVYRINKVF